MTKIASDSDSFPPASAHAADWAEWCLGRLQHHETQRRFDPMTNSVRRLAFDLARAQETGAVDHALLFGAAKKFCDEALLARADRFAHAHGDQRIDEDLVSSLLSKCEKMDFEELRAFLERTRAGVVFTAHPTFAMSNSLREAVAEYVSATETAARNVAIKSIKALAHAPDPVITLADEHAAVQEAITKAQAALDDATRQILKWARRRFPKDWAQLTPAPISLATWVGYDLDGRTDIHWGETFRIRLEEKARQLDRYASKLRAIEVGAQSGVADALAQTLAAGAALASEQAALFSGDLDDPERVTKAANTLTGDDPRRLIHLEPAVQALTDLINQATDEEVKLDLCVLRAEMKNYGLGVARIHLRINAAQVRSALRADLNIDQGREFIDRTTLTTAAKRAGAVDRKKVNFASIFLEQMTARRQLMLCAEFIKHIDADTPIRFLIAECEAPATVMGAVYLARLYGVEHLLDISPLFETPEAIERGGRFIERLLAEDEFVAYIRARGRIAIQIGFSDSGRFMGQVGANLAIERLQILAARALANKDIRDVEVVLFNTHGESMGRGGYPGTLSERYDYLLSPWTRSRYAHERIAVNAESSYQGGDGFLHFQTDKLATTTIAELLRWSFDAPRADQTDAYYSDINYSWDFYRSVKAWQEGMFENPDYHVAIGAFGPNMLFTTGSRKVRRQSGSTVTGPRALRAIPHNAILQQLGAPANVFGGAGSAGGAESDRLADHIRGSKRMQEIMGMISASRRMTSLPAMRGYAALFDASFWINKAAGADDPAHAACCEELAMRLSDQKTPTAIQRLANFYAADLAKLDRILKQNENSDDRYAGRRSLHALHSIRQSMIMRAFILAASIPSFSPRHDITRSSMFDLAFQLNFDNLADQLAIIFPAVDVNAAHFTGITEESDEDLTAVRGYPEIHRNIIDPLRACHRAVREIGVGLSHFYGAYG